MKSKQYLLQFIIPIVYSAAILAAVGYTWNQQYRIRQGGDGPLYRNLRDYPAWIRHGFDPAEIAELPNESGGNWMRFDAPQLTVIRSPLPNLPKRTFLSPRGKET